MNNNLKWRYTVGVLYLLYGIVKIILTIIALTVPYEKLSTWPLLSIMAKNDHTISAQMYEYIFAAFAGFTILYGLTMLYILRGPIARVIEYKYTELLYMLVLGAFLVIFYCLVLYTNVNIPKIRENYPMYELFGLGGGLSFIVIPLIWEGIIKFTPIFKGMSSYTKSIVVLLSVILIAGAVLVLLAFLKRYKREIAAYKQKLASGLNVGQSLGHHTDTKTS